jgi:hypothetical protein
MAADCTAFAAPTKTTPGEVPGARGLGLGWVYWRTRMTLLAWGPLGPDVISNSTWSPAFTLDEAVAFLGVEPLDRTVHTFCHFGDTPSHVEKLRYWFCVGTELLFGNKKHLGGVSITPGVVTFR